MSVCTLLAQVFDPGLYKKVVIDGLLTKAMLGVLMVRPGQEPYLGISMPVRIVYRSNRKDINAICAINIQHKVQ